MSIPIFNNTFDVSQATCTIAGIPCGEYVRDYSEGADRQQGPDLSKTYLCRWTDRFTVANACLGLNTVAGGRGGLVTLGIPLNHPEISSAYCSTIRIVGKGCPFQGPYQLAFPVAAITVGFKAYPWSFQGFQDPENLQSIDPDTSFLFATQEISQGEETLEIPASAIVRSGGGNPQSGMSVPFRHAIMRITFHRVPYMAVQTLPFYGNVNNATFLGCPKGQVRFKGSDVNRAFQADASGSQSVTNTYQYRPLPKQGTIYPDWNYYINPNATAGANNLWEIRKFASGDFIYPYADLTKTFIDGYWS